MSIRKFFSTAGGELSPAIIVRRVLFLLLLLGLSFVYLALDFTGLTSPKGIEQAQIGREVARAHGFETKMVRPLSLFQAHAHAEATDAEKPLLIGFNDTYHAPLNPLLNSLVLKLFRGENDYAWQEGDTVYYLDRVIAGVSVLLLLCSIGISYLLVSRIFDAKIGGVTALLMLLCELLWEFSQTGLPQMLMLFLFSFVLYFLYKAIEAQHAGHSPMVWLCLAAGFFGLLALAHWLAIWPFIGLIIFASLYFRPRGVTALIMFLIFLPVVSIWGFYLIKFSGSPLGSGYFSMLGGGGDAEALTMRSFQARQDMDVQGLPTKLVMTSLAQLNGLYAYLGSVLVAPLFFVSLLHAFKRPEIATFRWLVLMMWLFSVLGMSLFGLPNGPIDANQLHILFMPIMTGYGLAMLSVLWSRLGIVSTMPMIVNGHLVIVVIISALPMLLTLPKDLKVGLLIKERKTSAAELALLRDHIDEAEIVVTDVPWDVAWYADRTALWLPESVEQLNEIDLFTTQRKQPIAGVLLTLHTTSANLYQQIIHGQFSDWSPLIIWCAMASDAEHFAQAGMFGGRPPAIRGLVYNSLDRRLSNYGMFFLTTPERIAASAAEP